MIKIQSESDLLASFRGIDRDQVQVPKDFHFPLGVTNYRSWIEPSGHRVYLVFEEAKSGKPIGVVFQRTHGSTDAAPGMCQWCNQVRGGSGVSLLTAAADTNTRVGIHLCSDLNCGAPDGPGVHDMRESLSRGERMQRLMSRINEFAKKNLF